MQYAQLNIDGTYSHQVTPGTNVEWDATHLCPASALTSEEAEFFRVVPLVETAQPEFNPRTQTCIRNGGVLVNGQWEYSWTVAALPELQITANAAQDEAARIQSLWQAAHDYEYSQVSGSAIGLLAIGVMQGFPKCLAVQAWIKSIWTIYYTRKAGTSTDTDYSSAGLVPHSVPELMVELGI